jgi:prefoldin subunit 5
MTIKNLENAVHKLKQRTAEHHASIRRTDSRLNPLDRRMQKLERQVNQLESKVDKLKKAKK